jgi:predicted AAA+ superfamily ATPase
MIIIHAMRDYPRLATRALETLERAMPVAVVTGARQTGKTTLVRDLAGGPERTYLTLDDLDVLDQAVKAPADLIGRGARLTLDEVQRAPSLLLAIKRAVDTRRTRGRFVVAGSANLLLTRGVADSLAGRAGYLTLWPMSRLEQQGRGRAGLWSELLSAKDADWKDILAASAWPPHDWRRLATAGGYPTPALELEREDDRQTWFRGYVQTYLERDLADVGSVSSLPDYRRLMRAATLRVGQLINQTELGRDVALPQSTVHRWLNLLETSYQVVRVPAYSRNRTKRLIKTPKLYWVDTGLAMHLGGAREPSGAEFENLVLHDLLVWRDATPVRADICYWRTASGEEVDFVVDTGSAVLPIEVKATTRPGLADIRHLQSFRAEVGRQARVGLLLHAGDTLEWMAPGILAAPWWRVF